MWGYSFYLQRVTLGKLGSKTVKIRRGRATVVHMLSCEKPDRSKLCVHVEARNLINDWDNMSESVAVHSNARVEEISAVERTVVLGSALVVSAALYYVVGVDQGVTSVFGDATYIHEFVHDARHLLGFPCH